MSANLAMNLSLPLFEFDRRLTVLVRRGYQAGTMIRLVSRDVCVAPDVYA